MELTDSVIDSTSKILQSMRPSKISKIEELEVVFVDIVNGKMKARQAWAFIEVVEALQDKSKPIGLLLKSWGGNDNTILEVKEFPNILPEEQQILMNTLAELQDEEDQLKKNN